MRYFAALLLAFLAACSPGGVSGDAGIKFYRCPMHTWITSEHPGKCTICGMDLVPVREGEEAKAPGTVTLMPSSRQILGVETARVRRGTLEKTVRLSGIIDDNDVTHTIVSAFFDGRIDRVFVDHVGVDVAKDQPLAQIYSPELLYIVREFQAAARQGQKDALASVDRQRLVQFGLTPSEVERLASGQQGGYGIDLRAPMDGTLVARDVYPGKYVKAGEVLFEIADYSLMWFHARVYEQDLDWISVGSRASVSTPASPGQEFPGRVTLIDPSFDPVTRSTQVRIEVPNPKSGEGTGWERALPRKAYGEAKVLAKKEGVLLVPRSAVLDTGARTVAYVDAGGGDYQRRDVRVGWRGDSDAEVLSGLSEGDEVVVQGNLMIDAEAQMAHPEPGGAPPPVPSASGGDAKLEALSAAAGALSRDDLAAFNAGGVAWGLLRPAESLAEAREAFHRAVAPAADEVLREPRGYKVYECPMAGSAFSGAPQTLRWIQRGGPMRNPWLGQKMAECGEEVAP